MMSTREGFSLYWEINPGVEVVWKMPSLMAQRVCYPIRQCCTTMWIDYHDSLDTRVHAQVNVGRLR